MEQPHCPSRLASLTVAAPSLIALHNFLDMRSWTLFPKRIKIVLLNFTIVVWVAFIYSSTCFVNQSYNALPVIYGPQIKKHLSTAFGETSTKSCSAQEANLCLLNCLFFSHSTSRLRLEVQAIHRKNNSNPTYKCILHINVTINALIWRKLVPRLWTPQKSL